jgi:hypothetical protein
MAKRSRQQRPDNRQTQQAGRDRVSLGPIRLEGLRMARRIDRNPSQKASLNSVLPPMALFDFWRQFDAFGAVIHSTALPDNRYRVDATAAQSSHSTFRALTAAIRMLTIRHNPVATPDPTRLFAQATGDHLPGRSTGRAPWGLVMANHLNKPHLQVCREFGAWSDLRVR